MNHSPCTWMEHPTNYINFSLTKVKLRLNKSTNSEKRFESN
jgi:hypothetical protein